ncbi:MAG TPA: carboxypeptidase-like regulatory domain-containing protein, partial [Terriglobales bacterium]|nr:carboxypeptidase-like regulatory domain-containing protein [Terriglobales bacterium]
MRQTISVVMATSLLFAALSFAQQSTTSVHGTITDPKNAVVPNANVTIANTSTGFTRTTRSDSQGVYQFLQIPPGTYMIDARATGFADVKAQNIRLLVNTPGTVNLSLRVAESQTTVEVSGEVPLVNTQDATIGNAFGTVQIENLPFEGRDPVGILSLQPGVAYVGSNVDQSTDSRGGSVNGARSDQTNVTLDGVDNNDQNLGLAFQGALRSTLDSLQEFRVTTTNANADSGRSSGAQVSLVTKSGTNNLHGTVYEYHRPTFTTANDWFNKQAQLRSGDPNRPGKLIRNTFGGSVGGPIIKNRLFFFGTYEGQRTRESLQVIRTVPSADLRKGILHYLDQNGNIVTLMPPQIASMDPNCAGNGTCPLGPGVNPAVLQILSGYPLPNNTAGAGDGLNFQGFTFAAATPTNLNTYILKLDANLTSKQTVYIRGNLQNDRLVPAVGTTNAGSSLAAPQFPGQPASVTQKNNAKGLAVGHTWSIRDNLVNNLRYGYVRQSLSEGGQQSQHFVEFRGLDNPVSFSPTQKSLVPVHNIIDDVSWVKGAHTIQFGGNWRLINDIRSSNAISFLGAETNPSWLSQSGFAQTGQSLDPGAFGFPGVGDNFIQSYDLAMATLAGVVSEGFSNYNRTKDGSVLPESAPSVRHFRSNEFESYVQDAWRVRPNLTVTAGVRWTLLQPPYEVTGLQVAPTTDLNQWFLNRWHAMNQGETFNPLIEFALAGKANNAKPYWDWQYGNVAPRLAFAYSPGTSGKTSIRGGFGIYYDHFGEGIVNSFDRNGSFGLSTQLSNSAGLLTPDNAPRYAGLTDIPQSLILPPPSGGFPYTPPFTAATGGVAITWGLDNKIKTPYAEVFDFSLTRELPKGFVIETSYVGRLAHHLLQEDDMAMPLNIKDPRSGMDYFTAATLLSKAMDAGVPLLSVGQIPYWQNMFPGAAGRFSAVGSGCAPGADAASAGTRLTATQAMYDFFTCFPHNETSPLEYIDVPGAYTGDNNCFPDPNCSILGPNAYYSQQFSSLYAWRSIGNSNYHSGQFTLRHKGNGLQFDFNYTLSKSIDVGSNAERINEFEGFGFASQIINAWSPKQL